MRLVLFDSQLDKLKLPVLRTLTVPVFDGEENGDETPRSESVAFVARKYFEWVGTFVRCIAHLFSFGSPCWYIPSADPETDSPPDGSGARRCTLTLHKQGSGFESDIVWRWSEVPKQTHSRCEKLVITFAWWRFGGPIHGRLCPRFLNTGRLWPSNRRSLNTEGSIQSRVWPTSPDHCYGRTNHCPSWVVPCSLL
jgi:hypothetical protein